MNVKQKEELDWSVSDLNRLIKDMGVQLDKDVIQDAVIFTKKLQDQIIHKEQISILAVIFKHIIDPRGIEYISIDSVINLMIVAFAYLWKIGHKEIAILLLSVTDDTMSTEVMSINTTVNRNRIPKELKEELQYYFPYERVINANTTMNVVEESINNLSNQFYAKRWITIVSDNYIEDVMIRSRLDVLPADLKVKLAQLYIEHEKILTNRS